MKERDTMTTATKHPTSISAMLDAAASSPTIFRTKAADAARPWDALADAPAAESALLTVAQAAAVVPLSVKQLYRVAKIAGGPFRKVEGRWMAYEADLHRWIKEHPTGERSEAPAADGDSLADRVRRRREGSAS
jgi:hypothetical protein